MKPISGTMSAAAWAIVLTVVAGAEPAMAQTPADASAPAVSITANIALTTDYVWRGVSQSYRDPAIQGGFDLTTSANVYAGVWASSIDFGDASDANVEVDLYGGYRFEVADVGLDIGAIYYAYPESGSTGLEIWELYVRASKEFDRLCLSGSINVDPRNDGVYGDALAAFKLSDAFALSVGAGKYFAGAGEYAGWSGGATYTIESLTLGLTYSDNDMSGNEADISFTALKAF